MTHRRQIRWTMVRFAPYFRFTVNPATEKFPSQVAPNERHSLINEEDKRAKGEFGESTGTR